MSQSTHAKVLVVPPRLNLRRAASYNKQDRNGPLSSTSSRFNFNHLFISPPPSPRLPALIPPPKQSPTKILVSRPSRVLRYCAYLSILILTFYTCVHILQADESIIAVWPHFTHDKFEMIGQNAIPDFPTPLAVRDTYGKSRWTVSIPHHRSFPLTIEEYADMGGQCREVSTHARESHGKSSSGDERLNYEVSDPFFIDVADAENRGMLPPPKGNSMVKKSGHFVGLDWQSMAGLPVCTSSLTYVLESQDAGLGTAVMNLWMLYGLAKQQGRAFFIDDSRWAYGPYTNIFQPPPMPDCVPPPRHQMLPCPAQARHLVVTGATLKDILPALTAKFHVGGPSQTTLRPVFDLGRHGYKALFSLNDEDQDYVLKRIRDLKTQAKSPSALTVDAPVIGLHVRHGDHHPLEYQYRGAYIPSEVFLQKAQYFTEVHYNSSLMDSGIQRSLTIIASDDPMVKQLPEFSDALRAQERIRLASKEMTDVAKQDPRVLHEFKDEAFGWEGGFFAKMFWALGSDSKNNAANAPHGSKKDDKPAAPPSESTLQLRSYLGRAYMMDLAVLAGASDGVVCAVSATGCRMLALMMGWESAIQGGRWMNADGQYQWGWMNW